MKLLHTFAGNLKRYRTERGLSQEGFADIAGLHRTYISAIEREKRSIALDNVEKIASALGIDAYLLFVEDKKMIENKQSPMEVT
ncbi:helix-turn-helix domain-containing protein [Sporomusa aerivorans]|uniref:helix-turn-helix domain-containing protein n=1 Tax=Sporomusa aerivorans TaxID=204936 RepID=UPI00352A6E7F